MRKESFNDRQFSHGTKQKKNMTQWFAEPLLASFLGSILFYFV